MVGHSPLPRLLHRGEGDTSYPHLTASITHKTVRIVIILNCRECPHCHFDIVTTSRCMWGLRTVHGRTLTLLSKDRTANCSSAVTAILPKTRHGLAAPAYFLQLVIVCVKHLTYYTLTSVVSLCVWQVRYLSNYLLSRQLCKSWNMGKVRMSEMEMEMWHSSGSLGSICRRKK